MGCGDGWFGGWLRTRGVRFSVGTDIFQPYLKKAKESKTYDWVVLCDVRRLPFTDKAFDVVICMSVLEHLEKPAGLELLVSMERQAQRNESLSRCPPASMYSVSLMGILIRNIALLGALRRCVSLATRCGGQGCSIWPR